MPKIPAWISPFGMKYIGSRSKPTYIITSEYKTVTTKQIASFQMPLNLKSAISKAALALNPSLFVFNACHKVSIACFLVLPDNSPYLLP